MSVKNISVVMTTYNGEKFLAKQLDSLFSQTYPPKEIIICDDCSTDKTSTILEAYKQKLGIKYFINNQRVGVVNNFKKAVSLASSENYIALCDQDDIWLPKKLETSYKAIQLLDDGLTPAMIYSDAIVIDEEDRIISPSFNNELGFDKYQHCFKTLLFGNFVLGCTIMMNNPMKTIFLQMPSKPDYNHDAWITLAGFTFGKVNRLSESQILYRKHSNNVTFSNYKKSKRIKRFFNLVKSVFSKNDFLENQFTILKDFHGLNKQLIPTIQEKEILSFLSLSKASYIRKKNAFEKSFKGNWINRFSK